LSRLAKNFAMSAVTLGLVTALICWLVAVRASHSIAASQSPVLTLFDQTAQSPTAQSQTAQSPTVDHAFSQPPATGPTVRVAVIGGMFFTGFWSALADRYEKQTGVHVDLVAMGPKDDIVNVFKQGKVDVITMHASDTMINLVANGYALDAQPWLRNDLIIVGPPDDPAGIKGMTDAAAALRKIAAAKSAFVVHSSTGSQEVLANIVEPGGIQLDAAHMTVLFDDPQRDVLKIAAAKHAYTLIGRIPFRIGRIPNAGLIVMVEGDERLRRPYLVAVTNPKWAPGVHFHEARQFAAFLRKPETQAWIGDYGKGQLDDRPIFFPVTLPN